MEIGINRSCVDTDFRNKDHSPSRHPRAWRGDDEKEIRKHAVPLTEATNTSSRTPPRMSRRTPDDRIPTRRWTRASSDILRFF